MAGKSKVARTYNITTLAASLDKNQIYLDKKSPHCPSSSLIKVQAKYTAIETPFTPSSNPRTWKLLWSLNVPKILIFLQIKVHCIYWFLIKSFPSKSIKYQYQSEGQASIPIRGLVTRLWPMIIRKIAPLWHRRS